MHAAMKGRGSVLLALLLLGAWDAPAQTAPSRPYAQSGLPTLAPTPEGPDVPLTLPEAVYLGVRQNSAVRVAHLQRILDKFNLRVSESLFSPQGALTASLDADRTGAGLNADARLTPAVQLLTPLGTSVAFGWDVGQRARRQTGEGARSGNATLSVSVIQPLLRGAGYDATMAPLRQARLEERYNQLRLKNTVATVVTDIVRAYHQLILTRQQIALARGALNRARDLETMNRALIRAGRMAEAELVQAQATAVNQELALLQTENAFDAARLRLLTLLALDPRTRIVPVDRLTAEPVRVEVETARALAFDKRPDYLSQLLVIEAARLGVDIAKNQRLWDLSLHAGVNVPGSGRTGWRSTESLPYTKTDLRAGLQLSIPINTPAIEQREVQATVGLRQNEVLLEQLRGQIDQQVRDGVRGVDSVWRQYALSRQARALAEKTLETETVKLRAGRSGNFQVVSFQDQLRFAENTELTALIAYLDALVALDQQLGATLDTWRIPLNDTSP